MHLLSNWQMVNTQCCRIKRIIAIIFDNYYLVPWYTNHHIKLQMTHVMDGCWVCFTGISSYPLCEHGILAITMEAEGTSWCYLARMHPTEIAFMIRVHALEEILIWRQWPAVYELVADSCYYYCGRKLYCHEFNRYHLKPRTIVLTMQCGIKQPRHLASIKCTIICFKWFICIFQLFSRLKDW